MDRNQEYLRFLLDRIGMKYLVKVDEIQGIDHIPRAGPAILLINHIAFVDPMVVLYAAPRHVIPMAKIEVIQYPLIGWIPRTWGVIPVNRNAVDRKAIQGAINTLESGEIILIAPEGTRNPSLQRAKTGFAYIASHSLAPIVPVAVDQTIGFPSFPFSARWKEPGAKIMFGRPFRFTIKGPVVTRDQLRLMTNEAMYVIAAMLPENRRGYYSDLSKSTQSTIEWL